MSAKRFPTGAIGALARNRNFAIYFAGRAVSVVGDSFYSVALIIGVLQATHSVTAGATVLIAGNVPVVLFALLGGILGDRFPRNRVMLASDLVRSAAQFGMVALLAHGNPPLWALLLAQFVYGLGDAFFDPAATGILPQIVRPGELPAANSALQFIANSAVVVGPVVAGIAIAFAGAPIAIAIDALSFFASAISLAFLKFPGATPARSGDSMLEQLRAGFGELRRRPWVVVTASYLAFLAFAFNGTIFALGPAVALARFGGPMAWSFMLSAFGVGLLSGSFVAMRVLANRRALGLAYVGNLGAVPMLALLGSSHAAWPVVLASALAGVSASVFGITSATLLQQRIPEASLSRVGSYFSLARVVPFPIALAIVGPLASRFGIPTVFDAAALSLAAATLVAASVPAIWSLGRSANGCEESA